MAADSPGAKGASSPDYTVRTVSRDDLRDRDIDAWASLEARALEPNAFLSPYFVMPALRHLDPGAPVQVVFVDRFAAGSSDVVAAVPLRWVRPSVQVPLPHWAVYQTPHSYLGAPLVDREVADDALRCLLNDLRKRRLTSVGWVIPRVEHDGRLIGTLAHLAQDSGFTLHLGGTQARAVLDPASTGPATMKQVLGRRLKEIERCRRRLAEQGELAWTAHRGTAVGAAADAHIDTFLQLEHLGWKADGGSSLRSSTSHETFFREAMRSFATAGRAMMTELRLDGRVIASTTNLISGAMGFAFKIGWDPAFRRHGVGILNEAEFLQRAPEVCADLCLFDSGATPGSFIDEFWPQRRTLTTAFVSFGVPGSIAWTLARTAGRSRSWARDMLDRRTRLARAPESR